MVEDEQDVIAEECRRVVERLREGETIFDRVVIRGRVCLSTEVCLTYLTTFCLFFNDEDESCVELLLE